MSKAGTGHFIQGKYRVYGEGSEWHNGNPCRVGMDEYERHPLIMRHDYDSWWHYQRGEIASWWMEHRITRAGRRSRKAADHREAFGRELQRVTWMDKLMRRLFGPPFPQVPTAYAGLRPEDSIYEHNRESSSRSE